MVSTAKSLGSLSSSLLARKGQARPAMRSQGFGGFGAMPPGLDDLGWNDMGAAHPAASEPAEAPLRPTAATAETTAIQTPPVLLEREALVASIEAPAVEKSVSVPTATRLKRETQQQGKVAFTLRVDADRHLKLRLATALTNRSAQDLVTQALDALLDAVPEVDLMVDQLAQAAPGRNR